ncbi:MAG: multiheme c-type cytochrome [Planctomycetota bacterium]
MHGKFWAGLLLAGVLLCVPAALWLGPAEGGSAPVRAERPASLSAYARLCNTTAAADNSYCFVCHANYQEEFFARRHQQAGIGCMQCHGDSIRHSSDENGLTPPDVIYAKEIIDTLCFNCHLLPQHAPPLVGTSAAAGCTDCHGKDHRLKVRTRRWDKNTRKLIADDGVRMGDSPPAK